MIGEGKTSDRQSGEQRYYDLQTGRAIGAINGMVHRTPAGPDCYCPGLSSEDRERHDQAVCFERTGTGFGSQLADRSIGLSDEAVGMTPTTNTSWCVSGPGRAGHGLFAERGRLQRPCLMSRLADVNLMTPPCTRGGNFSSEPDSLTVPQKSPGRGFPRSRLGDSWQIQAFEPGPITRISAASRPGPARCRYSFRIGKGSLVLRPRKVSAFDSSKTSMLRRSASRKRAHVL